MRLRSVVISAVGFIMARGQLSLGASPTPFGVAAGPQATIITKVIEPSSKGAVAIPASEEQLGRNSAAIRLLNKLEAQALARAETLKAATPVGVLEKSLCRNDLLDLCLLGRFNVIAIWDNPFSEPGVFHPAGEIPLTVESGYFYFSDPLDMEIPIKILDFCDQGVFKVFAAGLTDFGVKIAVLDLASGIQVNYINNDLVRFNTVIDENPPFPCP